MSYYPYGMVMPGREYSSPVYRYGFQGQERDDEVKGAGNSWNYKFRMHDPRVGRFFAVDPLAGKYPHNSVYAFSENRVVDGVELEGLEFVYFYQLYKEFIYPVLLKSKSGENEFFSRNDELREHYGKNKSLEKGLKEAEKWYTKFSFYGRDLSAYGLKRYLEGQGGDSVFNWRNVHEAEVNNDTKKLFETKIAGLADQSLGQNKSSTIRTTEVIGRKHGITSDIGSFMGTWRIDAVSNIEISVDEKGNFSGSGTIYFTLSDLYDWHPNRISSLEDWADHKALHGLTDYGAAPFRIRSYYEVDFTFINSDFSYGSYRESNRSRIEPTGDYAIPSNDNFVEDLRTN